LIPISIRQLISTINGKFIGKTFDNADFVGNFSIDTRTLKNGDIFIAIIGERFDGNDFIEEAFNKGASLVISSRPNINNEQIIEVENTNIALQKIAFFLIKKVNPKIIAITGSNGKTTTKELAAMILRNYFSDKHVLVSKGNFNNNIGLPLTILELKKEHKYILLEMGMNHKGEIDQLCKIAPPDIAVITNIGEAHIENFKSRDDIASAKKEILTGAKRRSIAILPAEDDYYDFLKSSSNINKVIKFGFGNTCDVRFHPDENLYSIKTRKISIHCNLIGEHNRMNIMAAIAIGEALGIPCNVIKESLDGHVIISGRLEIKRLRKDIVLIDDTYNANPSSMMRAIDVLAEYKGNKILVIGDMAELGDLAIKHHKDLAKYILEKKIDMVFGVGKMTKLTIDVLGDVGRWYESNSDLTIDLEKLLKKECIVLVKGSRFMKMEQIVKDLQSRNA
jgi:UDP-N-acetylmuramoyl-tripeptide--D-alanyl-D-alanine ligase